MKTALLLIDIQNDYFPGGRFEVVGASAASLAAAQLLAFFRANAWPVVHVQHLSVRPGAGFLLPGTTGAEIHASVAPLAAEPLIIKNHPDSFQAAGLEDCLQANAIERLVIAGMMTHMCIGTTVRAAFAKGYQCLVTQDACATRDLVFAGQDVPAAACRRPSWRPGSSARPRSALGRAVFSGAAGGGRHGLADDFDQALGVDRQRPVLAVGHVPGGVHGPVLEAAGLELAAGKHFARGEARQEG
ncbi:MAG: Streptothricin hydrolase [Deltaproteobacteria bacterium ADurb.Bin510]|nr:MAG: Streptothricin hydrolase [Deltaproteobacteria bacterium ADurb.Bin510]